MKDSGCGVGMMLHSSVVMHLLHFVVMVFILQPGMVRKLLLLRISALLLTLIRRRLPVLALLARLTSCELLLQLRLQILQLAFGLAKRLFEPARQIVAARLLSGDRLLEQRFATALRLGDNARGVIEFRQIGANGFDVGNDAAEVGVDDERRVAAGASDFDLALELGHR